MATERSPSTQSNCDVIASIEAERRVLGTLLAFFTPTVLHNTQKAGVHRDGFYWTAHGAVYSAIVVLATNEGHADVLTVSRFLGSRKHPQAGTWLERVGGVAYLEELVCYADTVGYEAAARIVAEDARYRVWLGAMYEGIDRIYARDETGFWAAMESVKRDTTPRLRVIEGDAAA